MWEPHTFASPFKESHLRDQRPVAATTFSTASGYFSSSWRLDPNQTLSILHGLSVQLKELVKAQPFHEPHSKPADFSQLTLAPCLILIASDFFINFLHRGTARYKYVDTVSISGVSGRGGCTR